jgi:type IV/VI secretion system ImpK/VasF family protein
VGTAALAKLRAVVDDRLDRLQRELVPLVSETEAKRILFPLILHLDERVLLRLPLPDRLAWPLLQLDVLDDEVGGEAFYSRLDHLLRLPVSASSSIVLEVYYFCLADGFRGRFDDDAAIDDRKRAIRKHLAPGVPAPDRESPDYPPVPDKRPLPRSPAFYYVATAALVVVIVVLPIFLSNL